MTNTTGPFMPRQEDLCGLLSLHDSSHRQLNGKRTMSRQLSSPICRAAEGICRVSESFKTTASGLPPETKPTLYVSWWLSVSGACDDWKQWNSGKQKQETRSDCRRRGTSEMVLCLHLEPGLWRLCTLHCFTSKSHTGGEEREKGSLGWRFVP